MRQKLPLNFLFCISKLINYCNRDILSCFKSYIRQYATFSSLSLGEKFRELQIFFYSLNSRKSETSKKIISKSLFQVLRCASGGEGPFFFSHKKRGWKITMLCKRLSLNHTHAEEDRMISTENLLFRRTLLLKEKLQVHAENITNFISAVTDRVCRK